MNREKELVLTHWELARRDPCYYASHFVYTLDSQAEESPIKPWPARPHLDHLTRIWQSNPMIFIPKSRQMLVTWWAAMICSWCLLFRPGNLIYQQSKKLDDAVGDMSSGDGLMGRTKFILDHIPYKDWLVQGVDMSKQDRIRFPAQNSQIVAIAQGGDMIRSHTASGIVSDETAFQDEFDQAYTALISSVRKGWFVGITTPDLGDGGTSYRLAHGLPDGARIC